MEQRYGRVIARGTAEQIAMIRQALDEAAQGVPLPRPYEDCLTRDYVIEFHTPAEFAAKKRFVPGTTKPAYGYVVPGGVLWVNSKEAEEDPPLGRHIVRHEIAHALWTGNYLTPDKRNVLMSIIRRKDGALATSWAPGAWNGYSSYQMRCNEIIADKLSVAVSGKPSPWDGYAFFGHDVASVDLPVMVNTMFRMVDVPPPDSIVTTLRKTVTGLTSMVAALRQELAEEDDHSELDAQIADLTAKLEIADETIAALQARIAELEAAIDAAKAALGG